MEGVPELGRIRLSSMRPSGNNKGLFTSDLSVNEFLLVKELGFDPLGLVVGSSIYHIGIQMPAMTVNKELEVLSKAMYNARSLAMARMEEEATALGADGVVGVRLEVGRQEWGENLAEFIAIGTAIRARNGKSYRIPDGRPFTSEFSGQEFWTLMKAGYRPLSLVLGSCVYHVGYQGLRQMFKTIGQNNEMPTYTQALYTARELAQTRMQQEAQQVGADGVVGARIVEFSHGWGSHVIEYFALGTSVVAVNAEHAIPSPALTINLSQ